MLALTQAILAFATRWMEGTVAGKLLGTYAALWEAENDLLVQSLTLDDGQNTTALEPMGRSREIVRARFDTDYEYTTRLFTWLTAHIDRGDPEAIARAVWTYLDGVKGGFSVTLVERRPENTGHFTKRDGAGEVTTWDDSWDWDSISHPERQINVTDIWVIIETPADAEPYGYPEYPESAAGWPTSTDFTWGQDIPIHHRDNIMQLIEWARPCHTNLVCVIWAPSGMTPAPDGKWGDWGYMDPITKVTMPSRGSDFRYWEK